MATFELRDLHLVKKALAISVLVMEQQSGPFQSSSDILDMKLLLERLTDTAELEHYMRSAQIAVTAKPPAEGR
jgi:hypothetical protein